MKILALYSMKGGVGKTAACVNLAWHCARRGYKTLLCDLDPQGSSGYYLRIRPVKKHDTRVLVKGGKKLDKSIRESDFNNLYLLPSDMTYRNLDLLLDEFKKPSKKLKKTFKPLAEEFDFIFLDCPPNITLVSENVFQAADKIIVPIIPTTLSQLTYEKLLQFFADAGYDVKKLYAFFSMFEKRKSLHRKIMNTLPEQHDRFLKSAIPYSSDVEKMGLERAPLGSYKEKSAANRAFEMLWKELENISG